MPQGKIYTYITGWVRELLLIVRRAQVRRIKKDGQVYFKYKGDLYPEYLNKGNAMSFIFDKAKLACLGKGLDIGASSWSLPGAIPVQDERGQNAYALDNFQDGELDYIFSSHCLEHLERWQEALRLWIRKIKIGGIIFLYLPHDSMKLWRKGGPWVGYAHKWVPTAAVINKFLEKNGMEISEYVPDKDKHWCFYIIARRIK